MYPRWIVDDLALLDAWVAGDRDAAASLLDRHVDGLSRFFRGKIGGDVDDFVQEAFTRCLAQRRSLEPGSSFRAYLFAVARNLLYEHLRKSARMAVDPALTSISDLSPNASTLMRRADDQRLMLECLTRIPLDSQLALELFYWEELGVAELADVLGIPVGTVKSRLHRARSQLRAKVLEAGKASPQLSSSLGSLDEWERREP